MACRAGAFENLLGAVTRDGRYLTLQDWPSENLAVRDLATGQKRQLTNKDPKTELWLIPVQGGEPRKLDLAAADMRELVVHPDGRRIAFTSGGDSVA